MAKCKALTGSVVKGLTMSRYFHHWVSSRWLWRWRCVATLVWWQGRCSRNSSWMVVVIESVLISPADNSYMFKDSPKVNTKAKDMPYCHRGASRLRTWPTGLQWWYMWLTYPILLNLPNRITWSVVYLQCCINTHCCIAFLFVYVCSQKQKSSDFLEKISLIS